MIIFFFLKITLTNLIAFVFTADNKVCLQTELQLPIQLICMFDSLISACLEASAIRSAVSYLRNKHQKHSVSNSLLLQRLQRIIQSVCWFNGLIKKVSENVRSTKLEICCSKLRIMFLALVVLSVCKKVLFENAPVYRCTLKRWCIFCQKSQTELFKLIFGFKE